MTELRVDGLDEMIGKFKTLPEQIRTVAVKKGLKQAGILIRDDARNRAPSKTGELKKHIISVTSRKKDKYIVSRSIIVKKFRQVGDKAANKMSQTHNIREKNGKKRVDVYYAHFVEYGTKYFPARPFMRPALEANKFSTQILINAEVEKLLEEEKI